MKTLDYIFAARPFLHLPVWSIYLVSLHYRPSLTEGKFIWTDLIPLVLVTLMAAGAYYFNQIHDIESDRQNRKLGFLQNRLVSVNGLWAGFLALSLLSMMGGAMLSLPLTHILAQSFVLAYFYSAPPVKLKDRPISGLLANAYAFGFLIPLTVPSDLGLLNGGLTAWAVPSYFFLAVASIYCLTTIPDRNGDFATGKRTLAVIWPRGLVLGLALLLILASAAIAYRFDYTVLMAVSLVSAVPIITAVLFESTRVELLAAKFPILLLTVLAAYFFPGYLLFMVALVIAGRIYYKKRFDITYPKLS